MCALSASIRVAAHVCVTTTIVPTTAVLSRAIDTGLSATINSGGHSQYCGGCRHRSGGSAVIISGGCAVDIVVCADIVEAHSSID